MNLKTKLWYLKQYWMRLKGIVFVASGGYTCSFCGCNNFHFAGADCEGKVLNYTTGVESRMLISYSHSYDKFIPTRICPICALDYVLEEFDLDQPKGKCNFTGYNTHVIGIIWGDATGFSLRFGGHWWNGFKASEQAFNQAFRSMTMKTSHVSILPNGKCYYISDGMLLEAQTYEDFYNRNFNK